MSKAQIPKTKKTNMQFFREKRENKKKNKGPPATNHPTIDDAHCIG
jgi:hypothetical protein